MLEATALIAILPNLYCKSYGSMFKEEVAISMNVCWCSLGNSSVGVAMVVEYHFNLLVVCVLFLIVNRRKNMANSPRG